ncbi:MAG TPA: hypothetical protein VFQ70_00855 [Candidatus Saccharimonadaceae bacterium]|nr:hypothetical protein [Candidatus Saccharimonadaceae bacterium]
MQPQYSIDYLNQIAPKQKGPGVSNKLFFGVIGLGIILVIAFAIALISSGRGPSETVQMETMAARLQALQSIADNAGQNIGDDSLQSANANLDTELTSLNQQIVVPLKNNGINAKALPQSIVKAQALTDTTNRLNDAELNAVYDRTYASEMSFQLSELFILMREINSGSNSRSMRAFIQNALSNLKPIDDQLSSFTGAND